MNLLVAAAVVAGAAVAASAPFPAPKLIPVTDTLKCDWGQIISSSASELVISTPPGALTIQVGAGVKAIAADGHTETAPGALQAGQNVRVYYIVDNGARAREIDVVVPAAKR